MQVKHILILMLLIVLVILAALLFQAYSAPTHDDPELIQVKVALEKAKLQTALMKELKVQSMIGFWGDAKKYGFVTIVGTTAALLLLVGVAIYRQKSTQIIELAEHVHIPVKYGDMDNSPVVITAYLAMQEGIAHAATQQQAFEMAAQMIHLSTSFNRSLPASMATAPALPASPQRALGPVPAFREILNALEPGDPMVLGFEHGTNKAITGGFKRIYSCGIFGVSGSGKTTGLYSIISQSLLLYPEIKYMVIDPHAQKKEGLTRGLPKTHHFEHLDPLNVRPGLTRFIKEMEERLKTGMDYSHAPRVLLIDELPVIMRGSQGQAVEAVLGRVAAEGRGVAVYALISGQDTRLKAAGGNRDLLTSQIAYNLRKKQARYLFDDSEIVDLHKAVRDAKEPGLCVFNSTDDAPVIMKQPLCTPQDVMYVTQLVSNGDPVVNVSTQHAPFDSGRVTDDVTGGCEGTLLKRTQRTLQTLLQRRYTPFHDDPLFLQLGAYLQNEKNSLTKLGKMSDVNKGLLSLFFKGKRALSDDNRVKVQRTLDTVTPAVTGETEEKPSNVIPFLKKF